MTLENFVDRFYKLFRSERLLQIVRSAQSQGLLNIFLPLLGGEHDHRNLRKVFGLFQLGQKVHAVHVGHIDIADDKIDRVEGHQVQSFESIGGFKNLTFKDLFKGNLHHLSDHRRVIDQQKI